MKVDIDTGGEYISIHEDDGTELVNWNIEEWAENPAIVYNIAHAVRLATTDPEKLRDLVEEWQQFEEEFSSRPWPPSL